MGGNSYEAASAQLQKQPKTLGQVAYEGYSNFSKGKSLVTGVDIPEWGNLSDDIKKAWEVAAIAVHDQIVSI